MPEMDIQAPPELQVARVRHVGPFSDLVGAFRCIRGWAGARGLFGPDTPALGILHDDSKVTPEEIRTAIQVSLR